MIIQKYLKYFILASFILNLTAVSLNFFGIGSLVSYATFISLIGYYFLYLRGKPNWWLVYASIAYYLFSAIDIYNMETQAFIMIFLKTMIMAICGQSFFNEVSKKDMAIFLTIGASTVIINALFFPSLTGRASGF